jgi:hypothetical protein
MLADRLWLAEVTTRAQDLLSNRVISIVEDEFKLPHHSIQIIFSFETL